MDSNGTLYHLILGRDDWGRCADADGAPLAASWEAGDGTLEWVADRHEVILQRRVFRFPGAPSDRPPALADRRGAARDRHGSWYWIADDERGILVRSAGSSAVTAFWPPDGGGRIGASPRLGEFQPDQPFDPAGPERLAALAVTRDHRLVAGMVDRPGLLVFDLLGGGAPEIALWPPDVPFTPFDIAARRGGGVFILDRRRGRLWELDRTLRVDPAGRWGSPPEPVPGFVPAGRGSRPRVSRRAQARLRLADAIEVEGDPIAVEEAWDGSVLVLDRARGRRASLLRRFVEGREAGEPVALADRTVDIAVGGHDMALIPPAEPGGARLGRLFVADREGNQAFAFDLEAGGGRLRARLVRAFFPMRLFGGRAVVSDGVRPWYDSSGQAWLPLVEQRRPQHRESATIVMPVFDGREPGCVWHRLMLDACIPPGASVTVASRAADERAAIAAVDWSREPIPVRRRDGSELPFPARRDAAHDTWELLFQRARGRWLQLRLELAGDGRTTPRLRALRAWYPRFSYLEEYLPAVYREDGESASFLDRFLANLEGIATPIEDRIATAQGLLDPRSAPPEALDWLASWLDAALDPAWSEHHRRLFVANAMTFFQQRGTVQGIELALRLALAECDEDDPFADPAPPTGGLRVVEGFRGRLVPAVVAGDPTEEPGLRAVPVAGRWQPGLGGDALGERFRLHLAALELPAPPGRFPLVAPEGAAAEPWRTFGTAELGFVPSTDSADLPAWRAFLEGRYRRIAALAAAWGQAAPQRFDDAALPTVLPPDGRPLEDWYVFQSALLPMARRAHGFRVLLPVPVTDEGLGQLDAPERQRRLELARRIVALEKPAHTEFEVRFFWSAFRLGEARLGEDTLIHAGSRMAPVLAPAVLGREHLGESFLADERAPDPALGLDPGPDRRVLQ